MTVMTVKEAADRWIAATRELKRLEAERETAADVLKAHFRKNEKRDYKGLIGYAVVSQTRLDTAKVKAELGDRLEKFQKTNTFEQLSLLR
jgi:hypothetical protein